MKTFEVILACFYGGAMLISVICALMAHFRANPRPPGHLEPREPSANGGGRDEKAWIDAMNRKYGESDDPYPDA